MDESVAFKNPAFAVEKEWRLVVRSRELLKQGTDDGDHTKLQIFSSSCQGTTHTLRETDSLSGTAFPVTGDGRSYRSKASIAAPVGDRVSTWMAVRMLLDRYDYKAARIHRSEIPLAF